MKYEDFSVDSQEGSEMNENNAAAVVVEIPNEDIITVNNFGLEMGHLAAKRDPAKEYVQRIHRISLLQLDLIKDTPIADIPMDCRNADIHNRRLYGGKTMASLGGAATATATATITASSAIPLPPKPKMGSFHESDLEFEDDESEQEKNKVDAVSKLKLAVDKIKMKKEKADFFFFLESNQSIAAAHTRRHNATMRPVNDPVYRTVGQYERSQELGKGGFGSVFEYTSVDDPSRTVVLKFPHASNIVRPEQQAADEIKISEGLVSECRMAGKLFAAYPGCFLFMNCMHLHNEVRPSTADLPTNELYVVMEAGGPLTLEAGLKRLLLSLQGAVLVAYQLVIAVARMEHLQLIHHDIKPQNIMLRFADQANQHPRIKLVDYGGMTTEKDESSYACTRGYCPVNDRKHTSTVVAGAFDMYTVGRTFLHMLYAVYSRELVRRYECNNPHPASTSKLDVLAELMMECDEMVIEDQGLQNLCSVNEEMRMLLSYFKKRDTNNSEDIVRRLEKLAEMLDWQPAVVKALGDVLRGMLHDDPLARMNAPRLLQLSLFADLGFVPEEYKFPDFKYWSHHPLFDDDDSRMIDAQYWKDIFQS